MKIFEPLIRMSLSGAAMVLIIAVIRAVFIHKLPKKSFVLMWEIVIARLLIPLEIPAATSVYTLLGNVFQSKLFSQNQHVISNGNISQAPAGLTEENVVDINTITPTREIPLWQIVWLSGAILFAVSFVVLYVISHKKHRFAERVECDLLSEFEMRRNIEIRVLSGISSPLTYGLIKPVILLPKTLDLGNSEQVRLILAHEITHIKRFDVLRKIAAIITLCVHWFNPLVWVLFVLYNRDIELVCDDVVIGKFGADRREYARALVDLLEKNAVSLHNYFSKNAAEERIVSIMKRGKTTVLSAIVVISLMVCTTLVFATSAVNNKLKIVDIVGFESVFDSPIKTITMETGEDNSHLIIASDQPFADWWENFLKTAELRETDNNFSDEGRIIILTENGEYRFEFADGGRLLKIGGKIYSSDILAPIDKTLSPLQPIIDIEHINNGLDIRNIVYNQTDFE